MASHQEYAQQPIAKLLDRLRRTAEELADAIRDQSDVALSRRPGSGNWSAKEIICHLRDIEELCMLRYHAMLSMDEPPALRGRSNCHRPGAVGDHRRGAVPGRRRPVGGRAAVPS